MCIYCRPGLGLFTSLQSSRRNVLLGGAAAMAFPALALAAPDYSKIVRADLIFHGGTILTMDPKRPRAQAVAVAQGRIIGVGQRDELEGLRTAHTKIIDLQSGALLPGFTDPHMHTVFVAFEDWLDVGPLAAANMGTVIEQLKALVARTPPGEWVRGWQFDPSITPDAIQPTRQILDGIAPNHPVFIIESNGHVAYVNSKALERVHITRDSNNPPQGRFVRDSHGELTGRLEETAAMMAFFLAMPLKTPSQTAESIGRLFAKAASRGCTGLFDCGLGMQGLSDLSVLREVMEKDPPIRFGGALVSTHMKTWRDAGIKPGMGDDRYRISAIKAWTDGSNQAQTGYMREPYLNSASRGQLNYTQEALTATIREAHELGWQVCVHSNGDAAIDTTLNAYETVLQQKPRMDHRHRIEHCSLLHDEQIARMRNLGLSPSFLIGHVHYWGLAFKERVLGSERAELLDRCASVAREGLRATLHSDWNVTDIDPLRSVEIAVTRVMREGGQVLAPQERVPVMTALEMVTSNAAWQCRRDFVGQIRVGMNADFVVLDQDPTRVDVSTIHEIPIRETWIDGRRRFQG
ncbi:twin-arginine translocation pathway signal protein [Rhodoferax sp. TS-BS-61-7]|nr:twin-arginine translocation pathway signal protein [Rhodoferax sp. TS-BS-61-7]